MPRAPLTQRQVRRIATLFQRGDLSNYKIADRVGCGEAAVRATVRREGLTKNAYKHIAQAEIANLEAENDIQAAKNAFHPEDYAEYTKVLIEESRNKDLVMNTAQLLLMKINDNLAKGKKTVKRKMGLGEEILVEVDHDTSDLVNLANASDRAGISMGVHSRHAPKTDVTVNNLPKVGKVKRQIVDPKDD